MSSLKVQIVSSALLIAMAGSAAQAEPASHAGRQSTFVGLVEGESVLTKKSAGRVEKLRDAISAHDLEAMLACFSESFTSEMPVHPERNFTGKEQMRKNWSGIFSTVPDIRATLITIAETDGVITAEWAWDGHFVDGRTFAMRGVTVQKIEDDLIVWTRLYMEPLKS